MILYRVIGLNFEFRGQVEIEDEVKLSAPVIFHNCSDAFSDYVIQISTFHFLFF